MTTLLTLDTDCRRYSDARSALAAEVLSLNASIEALKREHLPAIKRLVARAAERHSTLEGHIKDERARFAGKKRTIILHGITIGYRKGEGRIEFDDPDAVLNRIYKLYVDEDGELTPLGEQLIHAKESPNKETLKRLPGDDLKKLGCTLVGTGDEVVIKPTDTAVDKIVNALLKDATNQANTEAA